jgi:hypothetical protein
MTTWVTEAVTAVTAILPMALQPPISYFLGLGLIVGVIGLVKKFKK